MSPAAILAGVALAYAVLSHRDAGAHTSTPTGPYPIAPDQPTDPNAYSGNVNATGENAARNDYYLAINPGGSYYGDALRATPISGNGGLLGNLIFRLFPSLAPFTRVPTDPNRGDLSQPMISMDEAALKTWNASLAASLLASNESAGGGHGI